MAVDLNLPGSYNMDRQIMLTLETAGATLDRLVTTRQHYNST
jgi:hypothetical protein